MNSKAILYALLTFTVEGTAAGLPPIHSEISFDGADRIKITWATQPGESYSLQSTSNLAEPWQDLQTDPPLLVATTNTLAYELEVTGQMRFFRVGWARSVPRMVQIPSGTFEMGDAFGEVWAPGWLEYPVHPVTVSAFSMDAFEVTMALWEEVARWALNHGYEFEGGGGRAADHPVFYVSWYDAVKWCNARSEREGRVPAYYTSAARTTVYRTGRVDLQEDWVRWNVGYRLPTEAEWEYAARGGLSGKRFPWGDTIDHSQANYVSWWEHGRPGWDYDVSQDEGFHPAYFPEEERRPFTSPVGDLAANGYGLYDMAGNLREWCWDRYGEYDGEYGGTPLVDPRGSGPGEDRVLRGGSWHDTAIRCRVSWRHNAPPKDHTLVYGFRCVLSAGPP